MIIYKGSNYKIKKAIEEIEYELQPFLEMDLIQSERGSGVFDMSNIDKRTVAREIISFIQAKDIYVKEYRSKNPWSRALGYFSRFKPNDVNLNNRRLNRSIGSIANTIVHEIVHMTDNYVEEYVFFHGNNNPVGKENTAPYWIGNKIEAIIDRKSIDQVDIEESIMYRETIISKVLGFFRRLF